MISIIIPTLNEEEYLPILLNSIKKQTYKNYEIIVADADSKDRTREIAKKYGCIIVPGGHPGKARNEGAKVATGDLLLFMDSDNEMPDKHFLSNFLKEFKERNLDVAGCAFKIRAKNLLEKIGSNLYNGYIRSVQKIFPRALNVILIKKQLHKKIGRFDESIFLGEDFVYTKQAAKKGKFAIISSVFFYVDQRRVESDGILRTLFLFFTTELHMMILGPIRTNVFKYKFEHPPKNKKKT